MSHPRGGRGSYFNPTHSFEQICQYIGHGIVTFASTTGELIRAGQGKTKDGITPTIVFIGEKSRHGNVCHACWGYRCNCSGTRIGQCTEALDRHMTEYERFETVI
jgi:hypothetical protein